MNSHINHYEKDGNIHKIILDPLGKTRKEIEKALQYTFNNDTCKVRSGLVSADMVELNPNHAHSHTYKQKARKIDIEIKEIEKNGLMFKLVTIEDNT